MLELESQSKAIREFDDSKLLNFINDLEKEEEGHVRIHDDTVTERKPEVEDSDNMESFLLGRQISQEYNIKRVRMLDIGTITPGKDENDEVLYYRELNFL
jgi:hypothetical protein